VYFKPLVYLCFIPTATSLKVTMKDEEKNNKPARAIPHGGIKRIAEMAGVSKTTASAVISRRPGISNAMRLHVAKMACLVLEAMKKEKEDADQALNAISL
jgi:head-tail adaptor